MKSVLKQIVIASAVLVMIAPAFAADGAATPRNLTKGTKSYQVSRAKTPDGMQANAAPEEEVSKIAPAAGAETETAGPKKSMKENLRLPRKN